MLFLNALDQFDIPATKQTLRGTIQKITNDSSLPSKSFVKNLVNELNISLKKAKNSLSIHDIKSGNVETMSDFFKKLKELYDEFAFYPECIFNTDEVGILIALYPYEFFSTWNIVRKNLVGDDHLTVSITPSAAGSVLKPFFNSHSLWFT